MVNRLHWSMSVASALTQQELDAAADSVGPMTARPRGKRLSEANFPSPLHFKVPLSPAEAGTSPARPGNGQTEIPESYPSRLRLLVGPQ